MSRKVIHFSLLNEVEPPSKRVFGILNEVEPRSWNAPEPVQTTLLDQEKLGYFASHGLYSFAGGYIQDFLDVGGRSAPLFPGDPNSDPNTNLLVAGKIGVNMDEYAVPEPLYEMDVWGDIKIRAFRSGVNPGVNYPAPVCTANTGNLVLCN